MPSASQPLCTVFVSLPDCRLLSVRRLSPTLTVAGLRERIELLAGLPANSFTLHYGHQALADTDTCYHRDGAVLKLCLQPQFLDTYRAVVARDTQPLLHLCMTSAGPGETTGNDDIAQGLFALLSASSLGDVRLIRKLIGSGAISNGSNNRLVGNRYIA